MVDTTACSLLIVEIRGSSFWTVCIQIHLNKSGAFQLKGL
ncbi:hypothetical protein LINGRAHAP2_LOCUS4496 [Linum grandiflorum]